RAPDHDDVHLLVEARLEDGLVELAHHLVRVAVAGVERELHREHPVLERGHDELGLRGFHGMWPSRGRVAGPAARATAELGPRSGKRGRRWTAARGGGVRMLRGANGFERAAV